jgi:hypothetical protein
MINKVLIVILRNVLGQNRRSNTFTFIPVTVTSKGLGKMAPVYLGGPFL